MIKKLGGFRDILRLKGLSSMGIANITGNAISGIFWFYIAKVIGAASYGEVSYFISISITASIISFLGAENTIMVYALKNQKILPPILLVTTVSSLVASAVLFALFHDPGVSLYVIGMVIFNFVMYEMVGKKDYKKYSWHVIGQRVLGVALAIFLYHVMGPHGIILGYALSYFPSCIRIYKDFRGALANIAVLRSHFGFMMTSYLYSVTRIFINSIDKLLIFPLFGFVLLGNYQLGAQLLTVLNIIPYTVFQYVLPHDATGNPNKNIKIFSVFVSVFLAILAVALAPIVLPALFPKYTQSVEIIQIMSLTIIPNSVAYMYISKFLGKEKIRVVTIGAAIYLFSEISGIIILGKLYGINGAAVAVVLGSALEMTYLFILNHLVFQRDKAIN